MTPLFKKFLGMHWLLAAFMACLLAFGVYAIFNASAYKLGTELENKWYDQLRWIALGAPFFFAASLIDYKWIRLACWPLYLAGIGGLVATLAFGVEIGGNKAWIKVGPIMVQPSQFAIAAGIMVLSVVFGDLPRILPAFRRPWLRLLAAGVLAAVPAMLVIKEDLGSGLVWGPVFLAIMLVGNIPFRYMIVLLLLVLSVIPLVYFFALKPYQQKRIDTVIYMATGQMEKVNMQDEGWVAKHLQMAIATGGIEGKGPESKKVPDKASIHRTFLPNEVINDFIFAVICEEFGFKGAFGLIVGLVGIIMLGLAVAFSARDQFGRLLVVGAMAMFFVHCFQNIGMNLVVLPVIGIPIPFISYGGTFMIVTLFLMGLVQSVWVHRHISPVKKPRAVNASRPPDEEE